MTKQIKVNVYFDNDHNPRGLVSVVEEAQGHIKYIQTVGSAVVGSDELNTLMKAALYTLNAFKVEE
jgi:hypothetical protein